MPIFDGEGSSSFPSTRLARAPLVVLAFVLGLSGCSAPQEAVRVELSVALDAGAIKAVTNDLGYEVELTEARMMVQDLTFAIAGEAHQEALLHKTYQWLVPDAYAHPGHYQGGDITGELTGRFLLDWLPGQRAPLELGRASLLVGTYKSANFVFERATEQDLSDKDDELLGHTMIFRGTASKAKEQFTFLALIDSPEDRQLVGLPFEDEVTADSDEVIHFMLEPHDRLAGDTMFDGLDFKALDEDSDGAVRLLPKAESDALEDAYNLFRRSIQTHNYYFMTAMSAPKETKK